MTHPSEDIDSESYAEKQRRRDREASAHWEVWFRTQKPSVRARLERLGIGNPTFEEVATGGEALPEGMAAAPADPRERMEAVLKEWPEIRAYVLAEAGVGAGFGGSGLTVVRMALAQILNPSKRSSAALEAAVVALAIGYPGMGGCTEVGRAHGVSRQAVSKRAVEFCEATGLPPSCYMKTAGARVRYRASNVRRRKGPQK
jgi:hypothetical protein